MTMATQRLLTGIQFLGIAVCAILGSAAYSADEPYVDYLMRRVSEGLAARESTSAAARFEGADDVALYADDLRKEEAPEKSILDTSRAVYKWIRTEQEPWIRHALIEALGEVDSEGNQKWISEFLSDEDPTLRARAAEYLKPFLTDELEQTLTELYANEELWWVRAAVIESLAGGQSESSLNILHMALEGPSRDVRAAATVALGQRGDARSVEPLIAALERGDLIGTDSPVWALGRIGDRRASPALEAAAFLPHRIVRKGAAWALGQVGDPGSERVLAQLLRDPDEMVRTEAAEALGELGGVRAVLDLLALLESEWSERVYYAMLRVPGDDVAAACNEFLAEQGIPREALEARRNLCDRASKEADGEDVWFWSSGELHSTFYSPANAKAREVWPTKGRKAVGWEDAIGGRLGGSRVNLDRETRLTIWKAAFYDGQTWLEVATGPYGGHIWVREADVRSVPPESLREVPIWTNYGATPAQTGSLNTSRTSSCRSRGMGRRHRRNHNPCGRDVFSTTGPVNLKGDVGST